MGSDDHRLVLQCQAGDKQAFRQLMERYQRRVYGIALGMVRNPDDAMDIAQEAFIKVHRHLDRFKGSSSFYTWLYRIVVNLSIDHLRKQGKAYTVDYDDARSHDDESGILLPSTFATDPAQTLARREIRELVESALETLSAKHRAVILMREVEGLSYTEMADAMQCSKGTIMSRLFHARRKMQKALLERMKESEGSSDEGEDEPAAGKSEAGRSR